MTDEELYSGEDDGQIELRLRRFYQNEANREAIEHRDMLLHLKSVVATTSGREFIAFLLKNFDVGELPQKGVEGNELHETIGFLRAGKSIFQVVVQADEKVAAELLAKIEREKNDKLQRVFQIENGQGN